MTDVEYRRFAKRGCAENGISVCMCDMVLRETSFTIEYRNGMRIETIDFVAFTDRKSGFTYVVERSKNKFVVNGKKK